MKKTAAVIAAIVAVLALLFIATEQTTPPEMTEAEIAQIEAEVLQLADEYMNAWKDMDTDCETVGTLIHPDYWRRLASGEVRDFSEWPDWCARSTANRAGYSGDWTDRRVRVISPDAAEFLGTYSPTFSYNDGRPPRHYLTSVQRLLVERTETGWGISWMSFANGPYEDLEG